MAITVKNGKYYDGGKPLNGSYTDAKRNKATFKDGVPQINPTPSSSPSPSKTSDANNPFGNINIGGTGQSGWSGASGATFSLGQYGAPFGKTSMTGDEILQHFDALAQSNSPLWSSFRSMLINSVPGYSQKELKANWTNQDITAIKEFLTRLNNYNVSFPDKKLNIDAMASNVATNAKKNGTSWATLNATTSTTPVISVPASTDLEAAAQTAFSKVLGRSATAQEAASFSKEFQDLYASYGQQKLAAKKAQKFAPVSQPVQFAGAGQTPQTPTSTAANVIEQPPTASVAAENYAARTNPTEASAQAAADGLSQFLGMLKG